jgi:hemolysin activation/secretion protein
MKTFRSRFFRPAVVAGTAFSLGLAAQAATPNVDAGALQRQTEQGLKPQIRPQVPKRQEAAPIAPAKDGGVTVTVTSFQFVGNTLLTNDQLAQVVMSFVNRPLSFEALQEAAQLVSSAYRDAGWVVRAYLPKQEVGHGIVTIQIAEAKLGEVNLLSQPSDRIAAARLISTVITAQPKGQALNANHIDRALLLLDDLPGVAVTGSLVEGMQAGETDLALSVTDEGLLSGSVSLDNNGSRSTGADRLSVNLALNSPTGWGDQLTANLLKTQGSQYGRVAYGLPVGYSGLRMGLHRSYLSYALVGDFDVLAAKGSAAASGLDLSYPLLRSQMQNITLNLSYDHKHFLNIANAVTSSDYGLNVTNLSLTANQYDSLGGGGANSLTLATSSGKVNLDNSPNQAIDAAGPHTAGNFRKANLSLSRQQTLTADLSLYLAASAQSANKNLDSSEKIYLGGVSGVRAYPTSEGGGSLGQTLTVELRQRVAQYWTVTGFYDQGHIKVNHTPYANTGINDYTLKGRGVSLAWQGLNGVDLKATVARRLGTNPAPNAITGMDGDGTLKRNRIWLNANVSF